MEHRDYRKGEIVAASGHPLDHLIVVAHGRLNLVYSTASGREQTVRSLGPGEFLGEMALFYDAVLEGDVIAAEDSAVCVLPRKAVKEVLNHPAALLRLVEEMARRLSQAEQLIADIGLKEVGQRLAAELVRLAQASPGNLSITVPMPWSQLAARLGTTPETLSRRLGSLPTKIIRQTGEGRYSSDLERDPR